MSKSFKKLVAIVSAIAMVIAGITVQPQTANAAEALEWSELTDGLGKATIKDTSTEEVRGAEYKGFETDRSWGGDSKWQGQAKVNDVTVEAGQAYKVSLDVSSTPAKKILVQTLSGGEYVEKEYDTTVGHIEQTFVANNDKVNIVVAFGSFSDDEVGKYDVSISNFKLEKTEKSEEQIEKERVEALLTGDENIAKGKTAFSNSVKEKDYQPEEAFDGNLGSRYAATSYESGVTLGVDLGKTYKVSSVAFKWENAYATEYNIQVSKDGKAYDTVKTMTADKAETIEVPLDEAVEARYVRIECVKNALNYGYSLWEMGVYGTEVAEVETTTNTPVVEPGTGETTTPAKQNETTTVAPTTKAISTTAAPATVKKTTVKATAKKLSSNKVKLSVKKVAGASKYAVQISTTKNFKKVVAKKTSKKAVFTVKSKKLKGKKKLYVRVKVYKKVNGKTVASQWSKATKIRLKK
ncbi:MAG: discoidin domain-containing protein [Eubacterium ventriosum]